MIPSRSSTTSMALSNAEYTNEQLNYFRVCYVTSDIIVASLREIFKQEWDNQYRSTKGEWKDEPQNGIDFYNGESPPNQRRNARLLSTMKKGNRKEWDCTMLFYAILFSDSVGRGLGATVRNSVDDLRTFRNEVFGHIRQGSLSEIDFQNAICKVECAFQVLGLPIVKIQNVRNQKTFPTEELQEILKKVKEKEDQRQVLEDQLQREAPSFCILPPKPSHDIEGRDREVAKIEHQLKELKESSDNRLSYLYISGNPGSGKSQLAGLVAKRFFHEAREMSGACPFVMTLNAASPDSLLESYASFARQVKCPDYSVIQTLSSKDGKIKDKIAHLKMLISAKTNCYTSWLLVVDNVSTLSSMQVFLPESGNEAWARGQLLITTQDTASIPLESSSIKHISVSRGMEPDDASSLLARISGITDSELAGKVAKRLDYQPLALAGAAVFVKEIWQDEASRHFGWNEYLKILEKGKRETTEDTLANTNPVYPNTMTKAITLAVEKLISSDKFVKHLFTLLSVCAPQPLNVEIAVSYIMNVDGNFDEVDKNRIRMSLRRCSLLLFEGNFIRVHEIVHAAIKTLIKGHEESQGLVEAVNAAVTSFNKFILDISPENRTLDTIHIVQHLRALIMVIDNLSFKEILSKVHDISMLEKFKNLGEVCNAHFEFNAAKTYFEHALTIELRQLGPEHVEVATTYSYLASTHQGLGDFEQAKEYQQSALSIQLKRLGAEHVHVAASYNNLALIYRVLGDLEQAKEYGQRALAIDLQELGEDHVRVAMSYSTLASIHEDLGDLEEAKEYGERALTIQLDKLGAEHVDVATSYSTLASIHRNLADFEKAEVCAQRALAIQLDKLGAEHGDVATSYNNLALILMHLGDLEQAKEYQKLAVTIELKKLGEEHVYVATTYSNLALILRDLGELEQAKEFGQRALEIQLGQLGTEQINIASSYNILATIHRNLGELDQARKYGQRALAIQLQKLGPGHVYVAETYSYLASIHQDLDELERAKEYGQLALAIQLEKRGTDHVYVAAIYSRLASIHQDLGDLEQAKRYWQCALTITLEKRGAEHVDVATSCTNLALIHKDLGELEKAKEYQKRALTILLEKLGEDHVDVAAGFNDFALILKDLGDLEGAKEYGQRALTIRVKELGTEHLDVAMNCNDLALIHKDLGNLEQAKEYVQRAVTIQLDKLGANHVHVASSYLILASIHTDLGDPEQGKEYEQRAHAIQPEDIGVELVDVATSYEEETWCGRCSCCVC